MKKGIDFTGIGACYFCHNGKGQFVMAQRSQNSRDERGVWDIGAGSVELGETVEQTLIREIKEEYCTDVISFELLGYRDVFRQDQDGNKTHWLAIDFKVLVKEELVKIGEPHKFDNIGWFTVNTLPKEIHSQLPKFLEKYKSKL
jgi:8-oxo-dGTP pyrophosphatase MutT (NUDIX family)